jgi:hypothetical protein
MAIWTVVLSGRGGRLTIESGMSSDSESAMEVVEVATSEDDASDSGSGVAPLNTSILASDTPLPPLLETVPSQQQVPSPTSPIAELLQTAGNSGSRVSVFTGASVEGRSPKNRAETAAKHGATRQSEAAVEAALLYLARHQRNNGSWTVDFENAPCRGECTHSGTTKDPHEIAATGLALLCFLGAGHTMHSGEYSEVVNKGVYYLIQNLKIVSASGSWLNSSHKSEMYEHGIATLALTEALHMTGDSSLSESCQAAITFIIDAQFKDGSWGYNPRTPGDLSIAGWQIMALKSAHSAKLAVSADCIRNVDLFLRRLQVGDFMFVYRLGSKPTASMTAIGTLIKMYRGVPKSDPSIRRAIDYLVKTEYSDTDVYYNYYATQVLFHFGGKPWEKWNRGMREFLVQSQSRNGHEAGSWWFGGPFNGEGGRIYTTAMSCLTLEVYYRYLPVYEETAEEFKF